MFRLAVACSFDNLGYRLSLLAKAITTEIILMEHEGSSFSIMDAEIAGVAENGLIQQPHTVVRDDPFGLAVDLGALRDAILSLGGRYGLNCAVAESELLDNNRVQVAELKDHLGHLVAYQRLELGESYHQLEHLDNSRVHSGSNRL